MWISLNVIRTAGTMAAVTIFILVVTALERRDKKRVVRLRMANDANDGERATQYAPRSEQDALSNIARAIKRLESEYRSQGKQQDRRQIALTAVGVLTFVAAAVYTVFAGVQWRTMQEQLAEMHIQSTIQREEIKAVLAVEMQRVVLPAGGVQISFTLTNSGKSDASGVKVWNTKAAIPLTGDILKDRKAVAEYDFYSMPKDMLPLPPQGQTIIAGQSITLVSQTISNQDEGETADGKQDTVLYGYAEYSDIFGTSYTIRWCRGFQFRRQSDGFFMPLPNFMRDDCERKTEKVSPSRYGG